MFGRIFISLLFTIISLGLVLSGHYGLGVVSLILGLLGGFIDILMTQITRWHRRAQLLRWRRLKPDLVGCTLRSAPTRFVGISLFLLFMGLCLLDEFIRFHEFFGLVMFFVFLLLALTIPVIYYFRRQTSLKVESDGLLIMDRGYTFKIRYSNIATARYKSLQGSPLLGITCHDLLEIESTLMASADGNHAKAITRWQQEVDTVADQYACHFIISKARFGAETVALRIFLRNQKKR